MVLHHRTDSGSHIDQRWHVGRQRARENYFHEETAGDIERERFDLDTAGITGQDNPRSYHFDRSIDTLGMNGFDVRELRNR